MFVDPVGDFDQRFRYYRQKVQRTPGPLESLHWMTYLPSFPGKILFVTDIRMADN